jgi:hypothetical protein
VFLSGGRIILQLISSSIKGYIYLFMKHQHLIYVARSSRPLIVLVLSIWETCTIPHTNGRTSKKTSQSCSIIPNSSTSTSFHDTVLRSSTILTGSGTRTFNKFTRYQVHYTFCPIFPTVLIYLHARTEKHFGKIGTHRIIPTRKNLSSSIVIV